MRSDVKVGALVLVALTVLVTGILLIGEENNLFRSKNTYTIRFDTVGGLTSGNPVQLNGVRVGEVQAVVLPRDPEESEISVRIRVDSRYALRIREDSQARIKTLGLLGDKYVEVTSGSEDAPQIPDGGVIPTAPATNVDELLASGEDVMDNVTSITFSLREILERTERGEGVLGELTSESETGKEVTESLVATLESVREVTDKINHGEGPLARLISDQEMGERLAGSVERLDRILAQAESGDGLLPSLLNDAEMKDRVDATLERLDRSMGNLEALTADLQDKEGVLQKLLRDEELAEAMTTDLRQLLGRLNTLSERMTSGDGTVAKLLNDDQIYESLNDILIGIDESWMLRWLIRNRQKAGVEERYEQQRQQEPEGKNPEARKHP